MCCHNSTVSRQAGRQASAGSMQVGRQAGAQTGAMAHHDRALVGLRISAPEVVASPPQQADAQHPASLPHEEFAEGGVTGAIIRIILHEPLMARDGSGSMAQRAEVTACALQVGRTSILNSSVE